MIFDQLVPSELKDRQIWFASIITRPIDLESQMMPISPSGIPMEIEAAQYIAPSATMRPEKRIQVYNQQYWWRLLSALHELFPLVTRLFGYTDFNQTIGIPYLEKYPPNSWSLNNLGERFPQWIQESYSADDKKLILESGTLDQAFNDVFLVGEETPINSENHSPDTVAELMTRTLHLQPYVKLFELDNDLFTFREQFLKQDPDYWLENDFPPMNRDHVYYYVMARTPNNSIMWKELPLAEFRLIQRFVHGSTIDAACDWLETQPPEIRDSAELHLATWLQDWTVRRWLVAPS